MKIALGAPAILAFAMMLTGCSDSSGDDDPPTYDELRNEGVALFNEITALPITSSSDLPTSGSASYDGVMVIDTSDDNVLAGEMELNVEFGASSDQVSGSVDNLVDESDDRFDGSLDITGGDISTIGGVATFDADIGGEISDPDAIDYDVDGTIEGAFLGSGADYLAGVVGGEACTGSDCIDLDGEFIVED